MDVLEKKWRRYHYKNLTYFILSVIVALVLFNTSFFRNSIFHLGNYGYFGAFLAGILFVSTFTVSIGTALLLLLAETLHPIEIGLIAGLGAVIGDLTIFHYVRSRGLKSEVNHLVKILGGDKIVHLVHTKYFSWTLPILGAFIIASPLPDEMGVSLMGITKMKTSEFIIISFLLNALGIFLVVSAGSLLRL